MENYKFNLVLTPDYLHYEDKINFLFNINTYDFSTLHGHVDYWEFTIVTDGILNHHINGTIETYPQNTLFFTTTKDRHHLRNAGKEKIRYVTILVKESHLTKILNNISPNFKEKLLNGPRSYSVPKELVNKVDEIVHNVNLLPSQQFEPFYNDSLCSAFLLIAQYLFSTTIEFLPEMSEKKAQWLQALTHVMQESDSQTYTVKDLCEKLNYSRMQLNRLFNLYLNTSPHNYLIDYKLRYAQNLLRNSNLKLVDIAMTTGYATLSQFNINFKQKFGMTPREYRKLGKNPLA